MDVDDTLVLILERIDSHAGLIRAASTCRRWCRVIADAGFLRHFRSLHGPPVAGDYYNGNYCDGEDGRISISRHDPWFVPSSSIDACRFSLDFVLGLSIFPPSSSRDDDITQSWIVLDSRGSILLMECFHDTSRGFPKLVVCEPLTRRYKIIPPPPDFDDTNYDMSRGPYLVDGDEDAAGGRIGMSNFRILCLFTSRFTNDKPTHTTVFTAGSYTDAAWGEEAIDDDHIASRLNPRSIKTFHLGHVLGSRYYYLRRERTLMTYDGSIGKFSLSTLPPAIKNCIDARISARNFAIVDGGDGEPRIVTIMDYTMEVFARLDGEWKFENKVLLSKIICGLPGYESFLNKHLTIVKRGVGFVVISPQQGIRRWPFSVDLKTLEVAPAAKDTRGWQLGCQYEFPWPPVLPVCVDR